jgi:hypothetical protein
MDLILLFRTFEAPGASQESKVKERRWRTMASLQKNPVIVSVQPSDTPQTLAQWIPPVAQATTYKFQGVALSSSQLQQTFQTLGVEANSVLEILVNVA